jgi:nicotinate-nucleotide adenylyltransferase
MVATRIGILGGSFNPAHSGHRAISLAALDALGLDEVWWLVSPGNPLKAASGAMSPRGSPRRGSWRGTRRSG